MDNDVVIEIRGGCLVGIYSTNRDERFTLIDWDDVKDEDKSEKGRAFPLIPLDSMPDDTRRAYEHHISRERRET